MGLGLVAGGTRESPVPSLRSPFCTRSRSRLGSGLRSGPELGLTLRLGRRLGRVRVRASNLHEEQVAAGLGSGRGKPLIKREHSTVVRIKRRPDRVQCEHGISTSAALRFEGRPVTCGRCGVLRVEGRPARVVSVGVAGSKGGVVEVTCGRCAGVLRPTSARRSR